MILAACLAIASCAQKNEIALFPTSDFEAQVDGKNVSIYTLKAGDLVMQVTNFGGRVVSLWVPDKNGSYEDIVLGYNNIDNYVNNPGERFLGAVVGPYANRIAGGTYTIGEETYNFPQNNNGQTLHGGLKGLDMIVWDVDSVTENTIVLSVLCPDGHDGMPGNRKIVMTYSLTPENAFKVDYVAETDKATHMNISHHSFFNLKGEGNGPITDHILTINADYITPTDAELIPTGELMAVEGTPFDFREPHAIGERIGAQHEQLINGGGYDQNWVFAREDNGQVMTLASVYEPTTGRCMDIATDQVAMQFYSGNFFDGTYNGKYGKAIKYRESLALETQKHPDAINHEKFPSIVLNPDEVYSHVCIYKFYTK